MKAPAITDGEWKWNADTVWMSNRQMAACHTIAADGQRTRSFHSQDCANAKLIAASKKMAEALLELMDAGILGLEQTATHDGLANCKAIAGARQALLAAGYSEE